MRNADLTIDEDEASDLLKEIENKLKMRQWGEVIRLEIEEKVDKKLLKFLKTELKVSDEDIFQIAGPIDLTFLMKMYGIDGYDHLRYKPYTPQQVPEITPGSDIFAAIRKGIFFCIIHTKPLIRLWISSGRHPKIRMSWRLNRHCIVSAEIPRLSAVWHRQRKTASRCRFWLS